MGKIYKRGEIWWGYWRTPTGIRIRQSLRTSDRRVAGERLRKVELAATDPAAHAGYTLADALEAMFGARPNMRPATREVYEQKSRHLVRCLSPDRELALIARDVVARYISTRIGEGAHPHTVHKELVVLRVALREAQKRNMWTGDPRLAVPTIRPEYTPRVRWLDPHEAAGIIAQLSAHRRKWFAIAIFTGMRLSEIENLRWGDIHRDRIFVRGTKTTTSQRWLPITKQLKGYLVERGSADELVVQPWGKAARDISSALARYRDIPRDKGGRGPRLPRPKLERISPNDLRRTFASWLLQRGVDTLTVSRLLGHSSTTMVERVYGRLRESDITSALDVLPELK